MIRAFVVDDESLAVQRLNRMLAETGRVMVAGSGTDPEAAQVLADAAGQVKSMANSLLDLSQRSPLGVRALQELLAPLLALVPRDEEPPR